MYQFTTPISAMAKGQMTAPVSNSVSVAMQQLIDAARAAQQG